MFNIQLNKRLQEINGVDSDFGGVSIIAIGVFFQLQPVFDGYVFESLKGDYGILATNLWEKHFTMYELHEIMRQRESRHFAEILNRLREGKHTDEDIEVLKGRLISTKDVNYPYQGELKTLTPSPRTTLRTTPRTTLRTTPRTTPRTTLRTTPTDYPK